MTRSRFLSRSIDYLGDLGAKLRDLQGYRTLAHELIQNADDAPASRMSFDIWQDGLILDNDGVFADCKDIDADKCPWLRDGIHDRMCDFHRFRLIGTGDKRFQKGTTGAFGIGFIAVYQLTDQPEVISAGHHWMLHEERSEHERIVVCPGCQKCTQYNLPGTRFIFPFAREDQTPLRQALNAEPVAKNVTEQLLSELEQSLPVAMLFLKNLNFIEVKDSGRIRQKLERVHQDDTVIISQGMSANDRVWQLLRGNFQSGAARLRHQHPERIEEKRSAEVVVALPTEDELSKGLLCACLPTEEISGLPFHINADFFPSSDRKRVILGEDYQSQWNREAIAAGARIVAGATPRLTEVLGAKRFWHLAFTLNALDRNARKNNSDGIWTEFWIAMEIALRKETVVLTSSGDWTAASSGVVVLQQREEVPNIHTLEGLAFTIVAEALRPYQTLLREVGVPVLDIETLCSTLAENGLDTPVAVNELTSCRKSGTGRASLWNEIDLLLDRQRRNVHAKRADEEGLRGVSLAPVIGKALWPCRDAFRGDKKTVQLFASLRLGIPFIDQTEANFRPLAYLCGEFLVKDAIQALERVGPDAIQQRWNTGLFSLPQLIAWFDDRRDQIVDDESMRRRLASLPIYPSSGRLHALTRLVLPGDFEDPIGLTTLADVTDLAAHKDFIVDLGIDTLDFRTYALRHLPEALEDDALHPDKRHAAVALLAERLRELKDDDQARQVLSSTSIVK